MKAATTEPPRERVRYQDEVWEVVKIHDALKSAWIERRSGKDTHGRWAPLANLHALDEKVVASV